jgi:hypothetical protein
VRRLVLCLALVLVVAACGSEATGQTDSMGSVEAGATEVTAAPTASTATTAAPTPVSTAPGGSERLLGGELLGRWAHYDVVAYGDGLLKTLVVSYGFNDFTEVDGQIIDTAQFCFSEQRTDQPIETSISDAATQAIKPPSTPVAVDVVDGTLRIRRSATPTPVGIRLDDPATETLPTNPDDPRIVDDDGDGRPGITVRIRVSDELTGEVYLARREIFAYTALLIEPDVLSGTVKDDSEQLVIGASDPIFTTSGANWVRHPDLTKSPIILRRVGLDWDCDRLAAERARLFPPTPDIDW